MKSASRIKMAATIASVMRASTRPGAPSIPERVQAVPRLVRCTVDRTYAGTTLKRLGLVAGSVAYVVSPIDLLPEAFLPVVGAADDAVVISWAIKAFFEETDRFLAWEAGQGLGRTGDGPRTPAPSPRRTPQGDPDASSTVHLAGEDGLRRDRDASGAAAPASPPPVVSRASRVAGPVHTRRPPGACVVPPLALPGPGGGERGGRLPEGVRQAATDYVLESVRKRLER